MIEQMIFVFTASVLLMASLKMIGAMLGNGVILPNFGWFSPTNFLFMYTSTLYQVWFWSDRLVFV